MSGAGDDRDVVDGLTDALLDSLPDANRAHSELARRTVRLATMLQESMAECLAPWGLTRADYGVLHALWSIGKPYELRPSELKEHLLLTSGGISGVLNRLEKLGLTDRHPHPDDKRSSWVRLTPTGVETADATARAWSETQSDVLRRLPDDVARRAADALRDVLVVMGDTESRAMSARFGKRHG